MDLSIVFCKRLPEGTSGCLYHGPYDEYINPSGPPYETTVRLKRPRCGPKMSKSKSMKSYFSGWLKSNVLSFIGQVWSSYHFHGLTFHSSVGHIPLIQPKKMEFVDWQPARGFFVRSLHWM